MRCALIEHNRYHEETLPTFVRLLNSLDIEPDVYMVRRSRLRDPFALAHDLRFRLRRAERIDRYRALPFRLRRYQLLIVSSMEPPANLERHAGSRTPLLGVMHNPEALDSDPAYQAFFAQRNRQPLVLGRHIAEHFAREGRPIHWLLHVDFGQVERGSDDGPTTFAVSGNVEFGRRNYDSVLDAAAALATDGRPFRIRIVGRSTNRDGTALREMIERRGLQHLFELSPEEVSHPEFFRLVASSDFAMPLLDHTDPRVRPYFETKLASSIPFAIGLGVPLIVHRDAALAYGVTDCGIDYEDGGLAGAMRTALASTEAERERWRAALQKARAEALAASRENLRAAIAEVRA
jgi:glycosyltransferase involved in cell wall biosynthesis